MLEAGSWVSPGPGLCTARDQPQVRLRAALRILATGTSRNPADGNGEPGPVLLRLVSLIASTPSTRCRPATARVLQEIAERRSLTTVAGSQLAAKRTLV
jgi:hypothetical protein